MKNFLNETCKLCKNLEISKNYDCKTELKSSDAETPYFTMHVKGDYTLKPLHIAVGAAVLAGMYLITSVTSMIKRRSCKK